MMQEKSLNEKIEHILAQEDAIAQRKSWKGRLKHIWQSDNRKQALKTEIFEELSKKALFTLFLIVAFVFALTISVL
jgi:muconolactone delta-isomerase